MTNELGILLNILQKKWLWKGHEHDYLLVTTPCAWFPISYMSLLFNPVDRLLHNYIPKLYKYLAKYKTQYQPYL